MLTANINTVVSSRTSQSGRISPLKNAPGLNNAFLRAFQHRIINK